MALTESEVLRSPRGAVRGVRRRRSAFESQRKRMFLPFVGPALVVYMLVMVAPTIFTMWLSLNSWAGAGPMQWAGVSNYTTMFKDPLFLTSMRNTFWIVVGVGVVVFAIAFGLTMILQDMAGRKFLRLVIFFPSLVPGIIISILWGYLFDSQGLVNAVLNKVGVSHPPPWLAQDHILSTILLGMVWMTTGTYTVIFMAAADRIPKELYEVADLAGANAWQRFTNVTLPMMWDLVVVSAILWCVAALKTFEFLLVFSAASSTLPPKQVWNFAMFSYAEAFHPDGPSQFGIAAASGVVILFLTLVLTVLVRRMLRREQVNY